MNKRSYPFLLVVLFSLIGMSVLGPPVRVVQAAAGSAYDLIDAVNADRVANGLAAYTIDSTLMSLAQAHSDYQASIDTGTHLRADGSGPGDQGIAAENIAYGYDLSVEDAIYSQWTDALHTATVLGPTTGVVGAGVAVKNGMVYYTLDVNALTGNFSYSSSSANQNYLAASGETGIPTIIVTSTTNPDGSVAHVILYGETLIQIANAYGISLTDLYAANPELDSADPVYYAGDVLIIQPAYTLTPVLSPTETLRPPTRTTRPTRTATLVRTATPYKTATPVIPTSTPKAEMPQIDNRTLGYGILLVSALGLIFVIVKWFIKAK